MKTQKTKLPPIPAAIYEILLLNKGGMVPNEILIKHVYGDANEIYFRRRSIDAHICSVVRPYAAKQGYEIKGIVKKGIILTKTNQND